MSLSLFVCEETPVESSLSALRLVAWTEMDKCVLFCCERETWITYDLEVW